MNIRNVNVIQGVFFLSSKKIRNTLLILLLGFNTQAFAQQLSEFYVPLPEASALTFFDNINADAAAPLITRTDIVIRETGTEVVYDPSADGYESQYVNDALWAATTERWGDNDCTNGFNPLNATCDVANPDILTLGEVLVFDQTEVFAGDYFLSNRTINLTRSLWPSFADTLLAGAFELFPTSQWGTDYVLPIGEGTTRITGSGVMFEQVAVTITARVDNTTVQFDPDGPAGAVVPIGVILDRGEQIEFGIGAGANGQALAILVGATISTDGPVQANVMTGDIDSGYEARFYTLFPNSLLSNEYYEAVGTSIAAQPAAVFLYNPEPVNPITVEIYNNSDPQDATPTTIVIPANSSSKVVVPIATAQGLTGLRFATTGGEVFSAYTVVDDNGESSDWGHVTTPVRLMGDTIRVGFAPGKDPTNASVENASPVWLIADLPGSGITQDIEVCVDAAGDGGALTDPFTSRTYDYSFVTQPLDSTRLYDNGVSGVGTNNNNGSQTGMLAFACDPGTAGDTAIPSSVLLAAAWGQDPEFASAGLPGFDVGTTIRTGSSNRLFLGDLIFEDLDGDGVKDLNESGLPNVSVTITVANPLIDVDPNIPGIQNSLTILTGADGSYLFDSLTQNEDYTITVVPPTNFLPVSDPDGMLDNQTMINLLTSSLTQDFGYSRAVIGDTLFLDIDGNGVQGVGEPGLPGVEVQVCKMGTEVIASDDFRVQSYSNNLADWSNNSWVETDDDTNVLTGDIFINGTEQLNLDGEFEVTEFPSLTRRLDLSGFTGAGSASVVIDWTGNDANYELNDLIEVQVSTDGVPNFTTIGSFFGQAIDANSAVTSFSFDALGSSTVDVRFRVTEFWGGGEILFINGIDVSATGEFCRTTTTDATGFYVIGGLNDATYTVTVDPNGTTLPNNLVQTADPDTPGAPDNMSVYTIVGGIGSLDQDFGYQPAAISGNVSDDAALPLAGVTVQLYSDPNGDGDPSDGVIVATTTTDFNGDYQFTNVALGDYVLLEIDPATYSSVSDGDPSPDAGGDQVNTSITDGQIPVSVVAGEQDEDNNFVDAQLGSISGLVWLDEDQDGINDIPEAGLSNVIVELSDGVCTLGVNCPTVQTDQFGNYAFTGLASGNYNVVVQTASLPAGLQNTAGQFGLPSRPVSLTSGANIGDQNFGYIAAAGTGIIGDRVWSDADGDGIQDSGEAGINNVTIELLNSSGAVVSTTVTSADGDYLFTNIPFGEDYVVRVDAADPQLAGFAPTVGPQSEGGFVSNPVNLDASVTTVTDVDFGFDSANTIVITDRVWFDSDGDQVQDLGEPGIPNVTVNLVDASGNVVASTVTDSNGDFSFSGISDGSDYRIVITDQTQELNGMNETTSTGGDETITGLLSTAAGDGTLNTIGDDGTPSFGYNNPGSIAGTIWSDADSSELQDNGESGIGGVVVTLTPPSGVDLGNGVDQPIATITAADGSYVFDGLPPGNYQIDVLNPPAGVNTEDPDGDDDNNTSVTLGLGGGVVDQDFGYFNSNLNDINGTVFNDTDRDGVEELGEPGIAGVSLDLIAVTPGVINGMIDINGDNVIDASDDGSYLGATIIDGNIDLDNSGVIDEADSGSLGTFSIVEGMVNIAMGIASQSSTGFEGDANPNVAIDGNPAGGTPVITVGPFIHTLGAITTDYWEVDLGTVQSLGSLKVFNRDLTFNSVRLENVRILVSDTPFPTDPTDFAGSLSNADFVYQILASDLDDPVVALSGINARYIRLQKSGTDNVSNFLHFAELKVTPALIPASSDVIATTVTDANGDYTFPGLPDGNYQVAVTDTATVLAGYDLTSGLDVLDATIIGADVNDVDFGYIKDAATGAISGEVFLDENGNNLADATETNFSGVDVYLCSNPVANEPCDPTDPEFITSTTTNTNGEYAFTGLPSGSYLIDVDPTDVPTGLSNTVDPSAVALAEGEIVEDVDIGYVPAANNGLLTGTVWTDTNGDGVIDAGEAPIAGVTINVFDPNSATPAVPIGTIVSGVDGKWEFTVSSGAGTLVDDLIVQYEAAGVPANLDSTQPTNLPDGTTQYDTDNVDVASDADNLITDLNFGFEPIVVGSLGSISGTIYSDIDQNGDYLAATDGEFAGITIDLVDSSGNIISTTTDANGFYSFTGLQDDAAGYSVVVTDLGNVLADVNVNETITNPISIVGGADVTDQDQGYVSSSTPTLGSVGNVFFVDIDMDGFRDEGEPGVPGVTVQCWVDTDASATPNDPSIPVAAPDPEPGVDNLVRTVITDANGEFYCTNLPAGQYIVRVTDTNGVLTGLTDTSPNNTTDSAADNFAKPFTYAVTSAAGMPNLTADFGVEANSEINGTVYFDENADGDFQPSGSDIPQNGIEVQACNTTGLCINVFTQPDGSYSIPVGPGTWTVMVLNPPSGTDPLEIPATNPIVIPANTVVNDVDFGYVDKISVQPGSISGTVNEDTTGDGAGDTPIVGAIVELYTDPNGDGNPDDGVLVSDTTTNGSGAYSFTGLPATNTNYVVVEVDPANYVSVSDAASTDDDVVPNTNTNDNFIPVTLSPDETDASNNFVDVQPGAISGSIWLDEDQDGINDIGEASLTGIIVELRDDMGNLVATTTTDANGDYSFPGVVAGDYTVDVVDASVPAGLGLTAGGFGIDPRPVTVEPAQTVEDQDFGYISNPGVGAIGDRVWSDADGDGLQDAGEAGIEDVTLTLTDGSGAVVGTTMSNANGDYLFTNVPFGDDYVVSISPTDAAIVNAPNSAYVPTVGDQSEGGFIGHPVTLDAALTTVSDVDFGFTSPTSNNTISDTVWFDEDGDGVFDADEAPIPGVTVNLYLDENNDGIPDDTNGDGQPDVIATATTDENGDVDFSGLPDGIYVLGVQDSSNELSGLDGTTPGSTTGFTTPIPVSGGAAVDGDNFGYNNPGLIAGVIYNDADNNSDQTPEEAGIASVAVTLLEDTDNNGSFETTIATVFTEPDGSYAFDGLPAGDYQVVVSAPTGTQSEDPDVVADDMTNISLGAGESSVANDFGYNNPSLNDISGTVFEDTDKDGVQDAGEVGIGNVTLDLVAPSEAVIDGGLDINGDGVVDATDDGSYLGLTVIDGRIDIDGNGIIDTDDDGSVNGVDVIDGQLDTNDDGVINAADDDVLPEAVLATTTTDANGDYGFDDLPDGDYLVRVTDENQLLPGYDITSGLDTLPVNVAGAPVTDVDYGYIKDEATGSISGEVFLDEDGDGFAGPTETNFGGVDIYLCSSPVANAPCDPTDPEFVAQTVTDTNGNYVFNDLPAGSYVVDADPADVPAGLSNSVDPAPVALSEGEVIEDVDVGYVPAANNGLIAGTVWTDTNGDGVIDSGEAPIAGVTVSIFDPNSATPAVPIGTVDTGIDGTWQFAVSSGAGTLVDDLIVQYDSTDVPANLDSAQPTNLPDGIAQYDTDSVDVASDADNLITDLNFGFEPTVVGSLGSISGTIYSDVDQNGDYLAATDGEFAGITIELRDSSGNVVTAITDENGFYSFTGLQDDAVGYNVVITDSANVLQDVNVNEAIANPIIIAGGADIVEQDQGYVSNPTPTLGSIGNRIFLDTNMDGFADEGEPGIPGVTVQCWVDTDASATPNDPSVPVAAPDPEAGVDNLVRTVTTDANGEYFCTNLPEAQYIVRVTDTGGVLAGLTDTSPNNTTDSAADNFAKPFTYAVTSAAGIPNLTADFGVEANSEINGTVYFDENADGDFQPSGSDIPQNGIEVQACNTTGLCINVFTQPDGSYSIPVGPGTWTVMVLNPPNGTDPLEIPATNPIVIPANTVVNDVDFGYVDKISVQPGSISGTVNEDTTGDGAGDTPIVGAIVELYTDPNGDGNPDDGVLVSDTTTNGSGAYSFTGLPATNTNYVVVEVDPANYVSVSDAASTDDDVVPNTNTNDNFIPVTLSPDETDASNNFVDVQPGAISGSIWLDEDQDGINDIGEASLTGIIVELRDDMGNLVATTTTDANGDYSFPGVVAGDYTVDVVDASVPAGLGLTAGGFGIDPRPVTVEPAQTVEDQDFGYISNPGVGAIGDRVWSDADGDGLQDAGEAGIEDVTLTLTDGSGAVVGTTMSNANGDYLFTNVPFGDDYVVSISPTDAAIVNAPNSAYVPTVGDQSEGGFIGHPVTLDAALTTVSDVDFGFTSPTSNNTISDTVWFDEDGDGVFDADEAPIPGVTVNLYLDENNDGIPDDTNGDGQPDVIATATTDENGDVDFSGLPDGIYVLGVADTDAELNGLAGTTPSAINSFTAPIPVSGGAPVDGDSFGYNNPGLIAGVVYNDADNNSDQTPDEAGVASVAVTLLEDTDGNGSFETTVATVFTAPDGSYAFDGLPVGDYQIVVSAPTGTQSEDPDVIQDDVTNVSLAIGESSVANDFGYNNPSLNDVSGTVFEDTDKDGVEDAGEEGIANVTLALVSPSFTVINGVLDLNGDGLVNGSDDGTYLGVAIINGRPDVNGDGSLNGADDGVINGVAIINGRFDMDGNGLVNAANRPNDDGILPEAVLAATTTDANGDYSFADLPDGDYLVRVTDDNQVLPGYDITSGLDTLPITVAGAPVTDVDYGYIKDEATGSISGEVFVDEDGDGLADDEEENLPGVDVYLCTSPVANPSCDPTDPEFVAETTTDVNGDYVFAGLPADEYVIAVDPTDIPSDLNVSVTPDPVSLSEGEKVEDIDVGVEPAPNTGVMSGVAWVDADNDGNLDPGEAPIAGLTITIFDSSGNALFTSDTAADGSWIISGIPVVDGVSPNDLAVLYDPADVPAGLNSIQPSNLPLGDTSYFNQDLGDDTDKVMSFFDFGFPPNVGTDLGSISGTIYSDADQDGSYVALTDGELQGVTINLLDSGGNVVATTVTDENGDYSFTGLPDGDYTVVVTDLNNIVSGLNPNELLPPTVTITGGSDATDVNAGYQSDPDLGSIGSIFWFDTNRDGIKQESESGIAGVTVQCWLDADQSETPNDPNATTSAPQPGVDNLIRTVVTNDVGEYYCTSLPQGQYIVRVFDALDFNEVDDGTLVTGGAGDGLAKPWTYALTSNGPNLAADFGVSGANSISGSVFTEDEELVESPDGVLDAGELDGLFDGVNDDPAAGVPVVLYAVQGDGSLVEIQRTTTDASGNYSFVGLPDGDYRIEVEPDNTVIDGFGQTADPDLAALAFPDNVCDSPTAAMCDNATGSPITLGGGSNVVDVDFGYQKDFTTTPVTVNHFSATRIGGGVQFTWESSNEVGHLGYQLYARVADGWELINDELIISDLRGAMAVRQYSYTAYDVSSDWFALIDVSAAEELTPHGPYRIDSAYGGVLEQPDGFDWTGIQLNSRANSAAEVEASIRYRLERKGQLEQRAAARQ